jgi:Fe-S cluster biogenesis protein NfuA
MTKLSLRLLDTVKKAKYQLKTPSEDLGPSTFQTSITLFEYHILLEASLDPKNEIQHASYKVTGEDSELKTILKGLLEAFCLLSTQKTRFQLSQIGLKELESFLRDENHKKAYIHQSFEEKPKEFIQLIHLFSKNMAIHQSKTLNKTLETPLEPYTWSGNLMDKIHTSKKILELWITPVLEQDEGAIELYNIQGAQVSVRFLGNCKHCQFQESSTLEFITEQFHKLTGEESINIVAM